MGYPFIYDNSKTKEILEGKVLHRFTSSSKIGWFASDRRKGGERIVFRRGEILRRFLAKFRILRKGTVLITIQQYESVPKEKQFDKPSEAGF